MAVSGQPGIINPNRKQGLYREDLAVSGQPVHSMLMKFGDYTERIWRYQDNRYVYCANRTRDYTERIWRYQDNRRTVAMVQRHDYTERIWRYQDNRALARERLRGDYTERIWRYQDNRFIRYVKEITDYTERIWRYQDNRASLTASMTIIPRGFGGIRTTAAILSLVKRMRLYREDLAVSGQQF